METQDMPGHLVRRLNQISVGLFMSHMNEAGLKLTPVQFETLAAIGSKPGIDQATTAGIVAYDRATLGKVIDRLEARGLIRREISPSDRRSRVLHLTATGRDLLRRADPHIEAAQPEILAGLSDEERRSFLSMLFKVTHAGNQQSRAPQRMP